MISGAIKLDELRNMACIEIVRPFVHDGFCLIWTAEVGSTTSIEVLSLDFLGRELCSNEYYVKLGLELKGIMYYVRDVVCPECDYEGAVLNSHRSAFSDEVSCDACVSSNFLSNFSINLAKNALSKATITKMHPRWRWYK